MSESCLASKARSSGPDYDNRMGVAVGNIESQNKYAFLATDRRARFLILYSMIHKPLNDMPSREVVELIRSAEPMLGAELIVSTFKNPLNHPFRKKNFEAIKNANAKNH